MSNFAHHPEYEQTKYSEKDMKNFIDKKIVFYDHFSDKNKDRFKNVNRLVKVDKDFLPEYLSSNLLKYQNLIE